MPVGVRGPQEHPQIHSTFQTGSGNREGWTTQMSHLRGLEVPQAAGQAEEKEQATVGLQLLIKVNSNNINGYREHLLHKGLHCTAFLSYSDPKGSTPKAE